MPSSQSGRGSRSSGPPSRSAAPTSAAAGEGAVYFEFTQAGAAVRVTAIDERTGIEATIVGAANAGRAALEQAALAKLRYVMKRAKS